MDVQLLLRSTLLPASYQALCFVAHDLKGHFAIHRISDHTILIDKKRAWEANEMEHRSHALIAVKVDRKIDAKLLDVSVHHSGIFSLIDCDDC